MDIVQVVRASPPWITTAAYLSIVQTTIIILEDAPPVKQITDWLWTDATSWYHIVWTMAKVKNALSVYPGIVYPTEDAFSKAQI